jgi:hypothetical protein
MSFTTDMESVTDDFIDTETFGVAVTIGATTIYGDVVRNFELVQGVESAALKLNCKATDVSTVKHKDVLTIDNVDYYVNGIQPDYQGMTALFLGKK